MKIENRNYSDNTELRAFAEGDQKILEGYAALYGVESRLLYENGKKFIEILERGAFKDVLENDVILSINHGRYPILARTTSGTLVLTDDEKGLRFRAILGNTGAANDIYELVLRGDIAENSFAFQVNDGQKWERNAEGVPLRRISRISKLFDVSVVTNAAYPQTEVYARGFEEFDEYIEKQEPIIINDEPYKDMAYLLKLKNK